MTRVIAALLLALLLALPAAAGRPLGPDLLRNGGRFDRPVPNAAFLPGPNAVAADGTLEGVLTLSGRADHIAMHLDLFGETASGTDTLSDLPTLHIALVQDGGFLIPADQGLVITGHRRWNTIIGPGRIWREPGDGGYRRAALPLTLVERNQNCAHQGSLTLLIGDGPSPAVSHAALQIVNEGCPVLKFDLTALLKAEFHAAPIIDAAAIRAKQARELLSRLPLLPLSQLALDHPGVEPDRLLAAFRHQDSVQALGVIVDGRHYAAGCRGRTDAALGPYPFCADRRLPSYSTGKSVFAALAQMRLGQMFGRDLYERPLPDLLPEAARAGGWDGITLSHLNDMASGRYASPEFEADEEGETMAAFLTAEGRAEKLSLALNGFQRHEPPGQRWVYHSSDTYLATAAMAAFLAGQGGGDLFDLMVRDVYGPLGLSAGFTRTIRSDNRPDGMPAGYYGLFYTLDDVARLGRFLAEGTGRIGGVPVLDEQRLRAALFRDGATGLPVPPLPGRPAGGWVYRHNSWGRVVTPETFPGLTCRTIVPVFSGYGGVTIMLPPNGLIYYAFSDGYEFPVDAAIRQLDRIRPLCP